MAGLRGGVLESSVGRMVVEVEGKAWGLRYFRVGGFVFADHVQEELVDAGVGG